MSPTFGKTSRLRVVVTGLACLHPLGGVAWDYLQYVIGLHRLGHDVYYYEDTWSWPYDPVLQSQVDSGDYSARFLDAFFRRYCPELNDRWCYIHVHEKVYGMERAAIDRILRSADLFVNVSGANVLPDVLGPSCIKVFLDTDPGYNQIVMTERFSWSENVTRWCENVARHDLHFTYAENMHGKDCTIPDAGIQWLTTRMPVVLDLWRDIAEHCPPDGAAWTTVMTWNAFKGPLVYKGVEYGSKGAEFEKVMSLPRRVGFPLKVALGGRGAPLKRLSKAGWVVEDGPRVTLTAEDYRDYIRMSRGEVSTAKHVYVATRSGWFSCRSACYLAAGRPVVVQDTGFTSVLPSGDGLLAFDTLDDLVRGLTAVEADYRRHRQAAVDVAREHFDADKVLGRFVSDCFGSNALAAPRPVRPAAN